MCACDLLCLPVDFNGYAVCLCLAISTIRSNIFKIHQKLCQDIISLSRAQPKKDSDPHVRTREKLFPCEQVSLEWMSCHVWAAMFEYLIHCIIHSCIYFNRNPPSDLASTSACHFKKARQGNGVALVTECHFKPWKLVFSCPLHLQYGWLISRGSACIMSPSPWSHVGISRPFFSFWHRLRSHQLQSHSHRCLVSWWFLHLRTSCRLNTRRGGGLTPDPRITRQIWKVARRFRV